MEKRFAIFTGGENCWANLNGDTDQEGKPVYMHNPFILKQSTFESEELAIAEAIRIGKSVQAGFAIMPVYFNSPALVRN